MILIHTCQELILNTQKLKFQSYPATQSPPSTGPVSDAAHHTTAAPLMGDDFVARPDSYNEIINAERGRHTARAGGDGSLKVAPKPAGNGITGIS